MPAPQITALPAAPSRADDGATFSNKADTFVAALPTFVSQANAQADFTDERATAAAASAVLTAADRVQTGLDRTATAADRVQTSLDRLSTTESASDSALSAANALVSEQNALASFLGTQALLEDAGAFKVFATYPEAIAGVSGLVDGMIIKVLNDATMGNRTTYYQVDLADIQTLSLDFTSNTYAIGNSASTLIFVRAQDFNRVAIAPANSTSPGLQGDYFSDATHFYYCYATNLWRRIAGSTF